jgi:hypothetical protein
MRRLIVSMMFGLVASACGGDGSSNGDGNSNDPSSTEPNYPDSLCTADECKKGGCDGDGSDASMPDCNAWQILGNFSFQAAVLDASKQPGRPERPMRSDEDLCPPNTRTPDDVAGKHCCQNVTAQPAQPAYRLTGLSMNTPPIFAGQSVAGTNQAAIEDDRYNWVMTVNTKEDGDVTITSGLGLQNTDGSFQLVGGEFDLGGETWNEDGAWDPHLIPATLSTNPDGTRRLAYKGQYIPDGRAFELPMWGTGYDYTMLVLSMSGLEMTIDLSEDLLCGGYLTGPSTFDMMGTLTAYLPLEPLRDSKLHFKKNDSGIALCPLTAQIDSCDGPVSEW